MTVVHFETEFDQPTPAAAVPVTITSGVGGPVQVVDGLRRGQRIVGRFESSPGLVGLKIATGGAPIRVSVDLSVDATTASWWDRYVPSSVVPRAPYATRTLVVRSQGSVRAAVLLGRRPSDFTLRSTATARFDLAAADVPDDGLLVIELAEAAGGSHTAVGVRIDSVDIAYADPPDPVSGTVSVAQLVDHGLASTGVPPDRGTAQLTSDSFAVAPRGHAPVWTLSVGLGRTVRPDTLRPQPGPLLAKRPTGSAAPRLRDKAIAMSRRKVADARHASVRRIRHGFVLAGRCGLAPVGWLLAGVWLRASLITATLTPLTGGPPVPCAVTRMGGRRVAVAAPGPVEEPAMVRLHIRGLLGFTAAWRLRSARIAP